MLKTIWIELFSSRQFRHQRVNLWAYYNAIILRRWGSLVRPLHAFVNGGVDHPQSAVQIYTAWSGLIEHSMDLTGSKYYATLPCTMSPVQGFVKRGRCTRSIEMERGHRIFRQISYISRTKFQNLNVSRLVLQLSGPNPLKPGAKSRMKM